MLPLPPPHTADAGFYQCRLGILYTLMHAGKRLKVTRGNQYHMHAELLLLRGSLPYTITQAERTTGYTFTWTFYANGLVINTAV